MRQDAPQGTAVRPMAKEWGGRLASLTSFLESFSFLRPHSIHISLPFSLPLSQFPLSSNLPLYLSVSSFLHFPFGLSPSSLLHLSLCFTITFYINLPFFTFILLGSRSLALLLLLPLSLPPSPHLHVSPLHSLAPSSFHPYTFLFISSSSLSATLPYCSLSSRPSALRLCVSLFLPSLPQKIGSVQDGLFSAFGLSRASLGLRRS